MYTYRDLRSYRRPTVSTDSPRTTDAGRVDSALTALGLVALAAWTLVNPLAVAALATVVTLVALAALAPLAVVATAVRIDAALSRRPRPRPLARVRTAAARLRARATGAVVATDG